MDISGFLYTETRVYLCSHTLVAKSDAGVGVRQARGVRANQLAGLVHVGAELEGLLL